MLLLMKVGLEQLHLPPPAKLLGYASFPRISAAFDEEFSEAKKDSKDTSLRNKYLKSECLFK
jgi:hypothetical protein